MKHALLLLFLASCAAPVEKDAPPIAGDDESTTFVDQEECLLFANCADECHDDQACEEACAYVADVDLDRCRAIACDKLADLCAAGSHDACAELPNCAPDQSSSGEESSSSEESSSTTAEGSSSGTSSGSDSSTSNSTTDSSSTTAG